MTAVRASDYDGADGGQRIQAAISAANSQGTGKSVVVVDPTGPDAKGVWTVSRPVSIPSHTSLILKGSVLRLADGANCAIFENDDRLNGNKAISIVGVGQPVLDGNPTNQARGRRGRDVEIWMQGRGLRLSPSTRSVIGEMTVEEFEEARAERTGSRMMTATELHWSGSAGIRMSKVKDLKIEGLSVGPTNLFGILVDEVHNMEIRNIRFLQDGSQPNQDGIGVGGPSSQIAISDISGRCGDDVVGLHSWMPDLPGGAIEGVTITDVNVENVGNSGLLRTDAFPGQPIRGVAASNMVMHDPDRNSEGHAVVKLGHTRRRHWEDFPDQFDEYVPDDSLEDQVDIVLRDVYANDWHGPFVAVFSPVKGLLVDGLRGVHTGPFFANYGSEMKDVVVRNCSSVLAVRSEFPYVDGMITFAVDRYGLSSATAEGPHAAVVVDGGPISDVEFSRCRFSVEREVGDGSLPGSVGFRALGPSAQSIVRTDVRFQGFESEFAAS